MKIFAFASALIALSLPVFVGPIATETGSNTGSNETENLSTENVTDRNSRELETDTVQPADTLDRDRFQHPLLGFELSEQFWQPHARVFPVQELMRPHQVDSIHYLGKSHETEILKETRLIRLNIDRNIFPKEPAVLTDLMK